MVTSGLDGVFPEGYPIGRISKVQRDARQPFLQVNSEPYAKLDRIRYVLLVWPHHGTSVADPQIIAPESEESGKEQR
ncbi:MAG: rod shape-determining protein MreC [Rheinheimera sp.]|nr:rod shape-determining protein MreC [Rheinheimera sp.]